MRHKNPEYFKRIIAFIDDYTANYGSSPSIKEISVGTELSDATICRYMQEMKANGELDYGGHRSIVTKRRKQTLSETVEIPVLGSISCGLPIECCHPDETGQFNTATYDSAVKLTAWLCTRFGLTSDQVIRHYDVTGKDCPKYYVENPDAWIQMKSDIAAQIQTDYALQGK